MNATRLLAAAIVAGAVAGGLVSVLERGSESQGSQGQPAYHRVLESGVIRAAYISYPPGTIVDPGTGKLSGIMVDVLNEVGRRLNLKVNYVEEVGWGSAIQGLSQRYETVAAPAWANPSRAKQALFSVPLFYSVIGIWVRSNETRFSAEDNWASLNHSDVKVGSLDGSTMIGIVQEQFPNAELVTYPDMLGEPHVFLELTSGKIDAFFAEPVTGYYYLKSHPGSIKNIAQRQPLRAFPDVFMLPKDEPQLQNMINTTIWELENSGFVDEVISRYEPFPNAFYRVARPYQLPAPAQKEAEGPRR